MSTVTPAVATQRRIGLLQSVALAGALCTSACGAGGGVPDDVPRADTGDGTGTTRRPVFAGDTVGVPPPIPQPQAGSGVQAGSGATGNAGTGDGQNGFAGTGFAGFGGFDGTGFAGFGGFGGFAGFGGAGGFAGGAGIPGIGGFGAAGFDGAGTAGAGEPGNQAPIAGIALQPQCLSDLQTEVTMISTSIDPDDDLLRCTWSMPAGVPSSAEGCVVSGVAFLAAVESTVELFVDDGRGGLASASSQLGPCANSP